MSRKAGKASWQRTPIPTYLAQTTYAPLLYDTHPIDLVMQPQGWGPFPRAWQQIDFPDVSRNIDPGFSKGNNRVMVAPGYQDKTLFNDPSLERVSNRPGILEVLRNLVSAGDASTAKQSASLMQGSTSRIRSMLGGSNGS